MYLYKSYLQYFAKNIILLLNFILSINKILNSTHKYTHNSEKSENVFSKRQNFKLRGTR